MIGRQRMVVVDRSDGWSWSVGPDGFDVARLNGGQQEIRGRFEKLIGWKK